MARQADERKFIEWRSRLARHAKSGLTVARFCEREDVAVATFHYWRRKCQGEVSADLRHPLCGAHVGVRDWLSDR